MNNISIIIPTVEYSKYLDLAIESCFEAKYINPKIFINMNSDSKKFQNSSFWNDDRISWRYATKPGSSMYHNVNDAIKHSTGEWLFILSDDDIILENFMQDVNLNEVSKGFIYCVNQIEIINEDGKIINRNIQYLKPKNYTREETVSFFLQEKIRHHISAFVFSRELVKKLNYFTTNIGYPNGYYGDYVFFGKLIANSDVTHMEKDIVFLRRESSTQGSAKFYFKNVTNYFEIITNNLYSDDEFKYFIHKYYGSRQTYKIEMMKHRSIIEWLKLQNKTYNKSKLMFIKFLYYFIFYWDVPLSFKICFTIAKFSSIFPKTLDSLYKKNLHIKFCKIKKFF